MKVKIRLLRFLLLLAGKLAQNVGMVAWNEKGGGLHLWTSSGIVYVSPLRSSVGAEWNSRLGPENSEIVMGTDGPCSSLPETHDARILRRTYSSYPQTLERQL